MQCGTIVWGSKCELQTASATGTITSTTLIVPPCQYYLTRTTSTTSTLLRKSYFVDTKMLLSTKNVIVDKKCYCRQKMLLSTMSIFVSKGICLLVHVTERNPEWKYTRLTLVQFFWDMAHPYLPVDGPDQSFCRFEGSWPKVVFGTTAQWQWVQLLSPVPFSSRWQGWSWEELPGFCFFLQECVHNSLMRGERELPCVWVGEGVDWYCPTFWVEQGGRGWGGGSRCVCVCVW